MFRFLRFASVAIGCALTSVAALPSIKELVSVLQPFRVEQMILAPDGLHLAYTVRDGWDMGIMLVDIDNPKTRRFVRIQSIMRGAESRLSFFKWANNDCLVYGWLRGNSEDLYVVSLNDSPVRRIVDAREFDEEFESNPGSEDSKPMVLPREARALGFSAEKPGILVVEAVGPPEPLVGVPRDMVRPRVQTEIHEVDIMTSKKKSIFSGIFEGNLLYDQQFRPRLVHIRPPYEAVNRIALPASSIWRDTDPLSKVMDEKTAALFSWTPKTFFGPRSIPLAFDQNPQVLFYASNDGRDTFGFYSLNLETKKRTAFALSKDAIDLVQPTIVPGSATGLVFDRFSRKLAGVRLTETETSTRWVDKGISRVQYDLEVMLPGRIVQILDWNESRSRYLLSASSSDDSGRFFVYDVKASRLIQFARRAPWFDLAEVNVTRDFVFDTKEGVHLTGYVTQPREPLLTPPPLLVYLHPAPGSRAWPGFDTQVQALARMGFIVLQINYRGSAGFGTKHRDAMRASLDAVPLSDIRAAIAELATRQKFDTKRIVLFGNGYGGFLALRALQLYGSEFRCAITLNAPLDLEDALDDHVAKMNEVQEIMNLAKQMDAYLKAMSGRFDVENPTPPPEMPRAARKLIDFGRETQWAFFGDRARLHEISVLRHPESLAKPALIIQSKRDSTIPWANAASLKHKAAEHGVQVDLLELNPAYYSGDAGARAQVFSEILEFLNENIYNYNVNVGPVETRK